MTTEEAPTPASILLDLNKKSAAIVAMKQRSADGSFKSVNEGIALQSMRRKFNTLRNTLPPLRLVTTE